MIFKDRWKLKINVFYWFLIFTKSQKSIKNIDFWILMKTKNQGFRGPQNFHKIMILQIFSSTRTISLMLRCNVFSSTCANTCYHLMLHCQNFSLALPHTLDTSLSDLLWHLRAPLMLHCRIFSCTCTLNTEFRCQIFSIFSWCYTVRSCRSSLALAHSWCCGVRSSLALSQALDASLSDLLLHLHNPWCYAVRFFLCACRNTSLSDLLNILLHLHTLLMLHLLLHVPTHLMRLHLGISEWQDGKWPVI